MAIQIHIPGYLREFAGAASRVTLDDPPQTVGEALAELWTRYPGVRDRVMTETGEVRLHVNVFVNDESIRWTGGLETVLPSDAEISIVPAVSGG